MSFREQTDVLSGDENWGPPALSLPAQREEGSNYKENEFINVGWRIWEINIQTVLKTDPHVYKMYMNCARNY